MCYDTFITKKDNNEICNNVANMNNNNNKNSFIINVNNACNENQSISTTTYKFNVITDKNIKNENNDNDESNIILSKIHYIHTNYLNFIMNTIINTNPQYKVLTISNNEHYLEEMFTSFSNVDTIINNINSITMYPLYNTNNNISTI